MWKKYFFLLKIDNDLWLFLLYMDFILRLHLCLYVLYLILDIGAQNLGREAGL